jgi:hypothetical protein
MRGNFGSASPVLVRPGVRDGRSCKESLNYACNRESQDVGQIICRSPVSFEQISARYQRKAV